jgi:hypothetical protein
MTDGEPDVLEIIDELAEGSIASREIIEELLDLDAIRADHGEVSDEILRRHVASVEQMYRMFGHHRSDEERELTDENDDNDEPRYGGYDKEEELELAELPPGREPRSEND